ncbi:hypothetical protein [Paracoccus yeei]|uniref:Uncharacterized protein n=1 Tax=Paracoccus yeei TaxID=147645 RepID=A0A5P2QW10_9RHOB|nr:hypothetical protein [Paracoccus yeei]QEU09549.1 hypothetical protein FOB51_16940 [Paracoccus yeei]
MKPILKSKGINESEKYLSDLAERTFLSLWSFPNIFRKPGTELSDLLVVYGQDIIIFSDKDIGWSDGIDTKAAWKRWYKKAILAGANSTNSAARWIREHPQRLFTDAANKERAPFRLEEIKNPRIHLVSICSGVDKIVKLHYKDRSGTFMLSPYIEGDDHMNKCGEHGYPIFAVGDVLPQKDFVHIFSREAISCVMTEFDTISDFIKYLEWRREGFRKKKFGICAGEEELVAVYWKQMQYTGWDLSKIYGPRASNHSLAIVGGLFHELSFDPNYLEWKARCVESQFWDDLIQEFASHVITGCVPKVADINPSFQMSERVLRFMASENRDRRIYLSMQFKTMLERSVDQRADRYVRKLPPVTYSDKHSYVFMAATHHPDIHGDYEAYREQRINAIGAYCLDLLHQFPTIDHAVGITIDTWGRVSGRVNSSGDVMVVEREDFDEGRLDYLNKMRDALEIVPLDLEVINQKIKRNEKRLRQDLKRRQHQRKPAFRI